MLFQRLKVYQVIYDCHLMLNLKIPFIVFGHNWFLRWAWILHNKFVKKAYHDYLGVKQGNQDKPFVPHVCCKTCVENLRNGKRKSMPFAIQIVWREGEDHITDCYFCLMNLQRINHKNKHHVPSAIRLIPHDPDVPISEPDGNMEYISDSEQSVAGDDAYKLEEDDQPVLLTKAELNLTQDLNLSKESVQLLGSCFKEKYFWHLEQFFIYFFWAFSTNKRNSQQHESFTVCFELPGAQIVDLWRS